MKHASVDVWGVAIAAMPGAVLGILAAMAYHVLHDQSRLPFADVLPHFLPQLITACFGGALVIGWAALTYDRRLRDRSRATGNPRVH